ncbi:MAG: EthD domain-containing protein [Sphingomonadales bacterium]|nr:EthD domain-containing protein [Sphingomonadales bacterium]
MAEKTIWKILLLMKRKPGMSVADFREYYETKHVPLAMRYGGGVTLYKYVRRFLDPQPHGEFGDGGELAYDVITELWFDDEAVFRGTLQYLSTTVMHPDVCADELNLFDRPSMRIATCVECEGVPD